MLPFLPRAGGDRSGAAGLARRELERGGGRARGGRAGARGLPRGPGRAGTQGRAWGSVERGCRFQA